MWLSPQRLPGAPSRGWARCWRMLGAGRARFPARPSREVGHGITRRCRDATGVAGDRVGQRIARARVPLPPRAFKHRAPARRRPCSESAVPSSAGRGAVSADPPTRRQARPGAASRPPRPTSQTGVGVPPPAAPPPGRHPPTAPGATCRCRDSRTTAASPGRVRRAGVPCTPASSALATQGGCASHAWVRPRRRSLALSPPPAVVGLKMSELRVDGHKAGAAKTGTGTALGNISVNSPDSKKLYTQKGGGSTIFRSWRESGSSNHSNQGERRSSGGRPVGVTLDVSASFDAGLGARGGKASADSQGEPGREREWGLRYRVDCRVPARVQCLWPREREQGCRVLHACIASVLTSAAAVRLQGRGTRLCGGARGRCRRQRGLPRRARPSGGPSCGRRTPSRPGASTPRTSCRT